MVNRMIRKAQASDIGRIAEILVYNNRLNYYPIFQDIQYSFAKYNVFDVAKQYLEDDLFMRNCFIYEDSVVKGFICVVDHEIKKLYVDSFFQGTGIGTRLMKHAIEELHADHLWALEKNVRAIKFYQTFGFVLSEERRYEEGTTEFLIKLLR